MSEQEVARLKEQLELSRKLALTLLEALRFAIERNEEYASKIDEAITLLRLLRGCSQGSGWT